MRASGNEIGLTIVRVIHRHGGVTPPLAATPGLEGRAQAHGGGAPRDPRGARRGRRSRSPASLISAHIEARWAERRRRPKAHVGRDS